MLLEMHHPAWVPKILELTQKFLPGRVASTEFELYKAIGSKDHLVLLDVEPDDVKSPSIDKSVLHGFILAEVVLWNDELTGFIKVCVSRRSSKEGFSRVENWARSLGAVSLTHITERNPKGYEKKYGFKQKAYVLRKPL